MFEPFKNYKRNSEILENLADRDGLVETRHLDFRIQNGRAEIFLKAMPDVRVFPGHPIESLSSYLAMKPALWRMARLEVQAARSIVGRAPIYGVDFPKAVKEAVATGFIKSRYQVPMPDRFAGRGFVADLLIHVGASLEQGAKLINLEAWQDAGHDSAVFYVHGIRPAEKTAFVHFDGASINFAPEDRIHLFQRGRKLKGAYRKHFRLDGEIDQSDVFSLAREFFPIEELTDEYFLTKKA